MANAVENKGPVLKEETKELAKMIQSELKLEGEKITCPEDLYTKMLPDGITPEIIKTISKRNANIVAAVGLAVGNIANKAMGKDKKIERVTMEMPTVGKDHIDFNYDRSREVPARDEAGNPAGTRTKFGSLTVNMTNYATKPHGQLNAVKRFLSEQAIESFGK